MLLEADRSQLLVVDVQSRLLPVLAGKEAMLRNIEILLKSADRLGIPVTVTEQYPQGLGDTIPSIAEMLPANSRVFSKNTFAAPLEFAISTRISRLMAEGRGQVVICGAEAHICVLQSALCLKDKDVNVFVVGDAVASRSTYSVDAACKRLLHACCHWVTTEMTLFEWLERAGTEDFKALSPLIR